MFTNPDKIFLSLCYLLCLSLSSHAAEKIFDCKYDNELECKQLSVHDKPQVILPYVIIRKRGNYHDLTPGVQLKRALIYVPGGPGAGAQVDKQSVTYWKTLLADELNEFDLVLYNPRGAPGSFPHYSCDNLLPDHKAQFALKLSAEEERRMLYDAYKKCSLKMNKNKSSLHLGEFLSAEKHLLDLEMLIAELEYQEVHLLAESWGTWLALQVNNPKIKSRIVDSSFPPGFEGDVHWINSLSARFDIYQTLFPDFSAWWRKAINKVNTRKAELRIELSQDLFVSPIYFTLTEQRLFDLAFYALYSENLRLPFYESLKYLSVIDNEKDENSIYKDSFILILQSYLNNYFDPDFSLLAWYATQCSLKSRQKNTQIGELENPLGNFNYPLEAQFIYDICELPLFKANTTFKAKLNEHIRTLILVGEYDPVTPVVWSQELAEQLGKKANLIIAKGAGHGVITGDYCKIEIIKTFIYDSNTNLNSFCEM